MIRPYTDCPRCRILVRIEADGEITPHECLGRQRMPRLKRIPETLKAKVAQKIKALLHACRDAMRNRGQDTTKVTFDVSCGWYGEAFGVMQGLQILNYGDFQADNVSGLHYGHAQPEANLKWWFAQLCDEVLAEEGWQVNNRCEWCLEKYGKDAVRNRVAREAS